MSEPSLNKHADLTTITFGILATPGPLPALADPPLARKTGKELERAVRFIQQRILQSAPKFKGTEFTIESNKIVTVSGVRHEIDVLVKTHPDSQYQSTWIFECKDWKKPVGKKEISDLKEKVRAVAANHAFLVAKKISRDAAASIAQDNRLSYIPATDNFLSPFNNLQLVHASFDLQPIRISIKQRGTPPKANPDILDWRNCKCHSEGKILELIDYIRPFVDDLVVRQDPETMDKHMQIGTHLDRRAERLVFDDGELTFNEMPIQQMDIEVQFFITVERQKLLSKFELKNQGRCFSFAPLENILPGKSFQIDLVQRL